MSMKNNKILKIFASVVLTLSILAAFVSGGLIAMIGSRDLSSDSAEAIYDNYLGNIVYDKEARAHDYYMFYIQSLDNSDMEYHVTSYQNDFAEANSNYFFRITPEDTEKYPGLANYYTDDYQYHETSYHEEQLYKDEYTLTCQIPLSSIVDAWENVAKDVFANEGADGYDTDFYDGNYEDDYTISYDEEYDGYEEPKYSGYYYEENGKDVYLPREIGERYVRWEAISFGDVWIHYEAEDIDSAVKSESVYLLLDGTNFRYNLTKDAAFQKEYKKFLEAIDGNGFYCNDISYDGESGTLTALLSETETIAYQIDSYVKTTFTAHDDFYNSMFLKYCKPIANMAPYVFGISIVLMLVLSGYLIAAAGHRAGEDTLTCNLFDRIPYDLFLYFYIILVSVWYENMWSYNYSRSGMLVICAVFGGLVAVTFPPVMMTTATRLKVDGWGMFKNTIIWKLLVLCKRLLVFLWKKVVLLVSFLGRYFNLYWKWLGAFSVLEFVKAMVWYCADPEVSVFVTVIFDAFIIYMLLKTIRDLYTLKKGAEIIAKGEISYTVDTDHMAHELKQHGENLNSIRDGIKLAVEERMKSERMKTELITNVSHDIKTPLTSIISYVDLISKEEGLSKTEQEYVEVLQRQSARLKKLIEDLIEASKASTGNLDVKLTKMDVEVLIGQVLGEYETKLQEHGLTVIVTNHRAKKDGQETENAACVMADGRHLWRVFDNLIGNIVKYAQENSRVYIDIADAPTDNMLQVTVKNISREALNISGDELMERFVRGDRSRNTEGSGLGLSIAKNLMELQGGKVEIMIDGDLFKVVLLLIVGFC